ncbi:hypothetical protein SNE40_010057 [Patella caerulea]|uniref:Uncharacterized protein n=1 Tax=Patella caerulea TaxID=87958 RepID=A0AAN8K067_PATCE
MKVLIVLTVGLLFALAACETCDDDADDCHLFYCNSGTTKRCINKVCTCVSRCDDDQEKCETASHCQHDADKHGCQCDSSYHCIDRYCHCGFPAFPTQTPVV